MRSQSFRRASQNARGQGGTRRLGFGELLLKFKDLPFKALGGPLGVEYRLGQVFSEGAQQARPVTGDGPVAATDVFSGSNVAANHVGKALGRDGTQE